MSDFLVEDSPSDRAKCYRCKKKILRDELRLCSYSHKGNYLFKNYYCNNCGIRKLKEELDNIQNQIKQMEKN